MQGFMKDYFLILRRRKPNKKSIKIYVEGELPRLFKTKKYWGFHF